MTIYLNFDFQRGKPRCCNGTFTNVILHCCWQRIFKNKLF